MKYLLDTHILLWVAIEPELLSQKAKEIIENPSHQLFFSSASIWEIAIKSSLKRSDFDVMPDVFRRGLLESGYHEQAIWGTHCAQTMNLPDIHKDPFDRILLAQAICEGFILLTADEQIAKYPGPIVRV